MGIGVCDDLKLGGTLAPTGITGGLSVNSTAIQVADWADIYGWPGMSGAVVEVYGRPGGYTAGDLLPQSRFLQANMRFTRNGPNGTLVEPTDSEQLVANTDDFLRLLGTPGQLLELDMPDGTSRFLTVSAMDPGPITLAELVRDGAFPLVSPWPFWQQGGQEETDTISAADTLTVDADSTADVYNAVLEFAGDGTFTHNDLGWAIEVVGSGGAVTVDLGARSVSEGGNPANNLIRRTGGRVWGWFARGANSVTSDVSVTVTWRNQYA